MHHENISRNDHHPSLIDQPPDMLKTNVDSEPNQEGQTNSPLKSPVTTMALITTVSTDASEKNFDQLNGKGNVNQSWLMPSSLPPGRARRQLSPRSPRSI